MGNVSVDKRFPYIGGYLKVAVSGKLFAIGSGRVVGAAKLIGGVRALLGKAAVFVGFVSVTIACFVSTRRD